MHFSHTQSAKRSSCVFVFHLLYVAGMFEESQQWEIHFERLACSSHAACAEVPTTASGTVTCTYTPTLLSLYITGTVLE